jgi:hypothetical protein
MALDGPCYPPLLGGRTAVAGELAVGPLGLLGLLETRLGLKALHDPEIVRRVRYSRRLKEADDGKRFYSRSLAIDEFGVAAALLAWREELLRGGWDGTADAKAPRRIRDLAAVEGIPDDSTSALGTAERFRRATAGIRREGIDLQSLVLIEPERGLPPPLPGLVDALRKAGVRIEERKTTPTASSGDLGAFKQAILKGGTAEAAGDGSLVVLQPDSDALAAELVAGRLASGIPADAVVLDPGIDDSLDRALRMHGLASTGVAVSSPWRPALQVLPLSFALRWDPLDPYRLLEFLMLPTSPLPRFAAARLASALAESPGMGGQEWKEALEEIEKDQSDEDRENVRARIAEWIPTQRYAPATGIPTREAVALAGRVAQWAMARAQKSPSPLLEAAAGQAARFRDLLQRWGKDSLDRITLERLLDAQTQEGIPRPGVEAGSGHVPLVRNPGAVIGPLGTLIWWDFTEASARSARPSPWNPAELQWLTLRGVRIMGADESNVQAGQAALTPILQTRERVVLVAPLRVRGELVAPHPVWDRIVAVFGDSARRLQQASSAALSDRKPVAGAEVAVTDVAPKPLPALRRWWDLPPGTLVSERPESYTSLSCFVFHPFQWVFRQVARLQAGALGGLKDGELLLGSLAHSLIGEVASNPDLVGHARPEDIRSTLEKRLPGLLAESGAALLLPGREVDRRRLLDNSVRSAWLLVGVMRKGGWVKAEVEKPLEGTFFGGTLTGSADIVLENRAGEKALLDMKWGGRNYRHADLKDNRPLQLGIYAHLLRGGGANWPEPGYLVIEDAEILAWSESAFPGATGVAAGAGGLPELWAAFEQLWRWRREQLDRGRVENTSEGTAPDEGSAPPAGALAVEKNCRFNDYRNLSGFPEEVR